MNIALVFNGLGIGGVEKVGSNYAKLLVEAGHKVDVYNLNPKLNSMENRFPRETTIIRKSFPLLLVPGYYILLVKKYAWGKYAYPVIYFLTTILLHLRKIFAGDKKKYDVVIAFSGHLRDLTFVAQEFVQADKKVCWVHGAMISNLATASTYGDLYAKIKNVCVLSEHMQELAIYGNRKLSDLNIRKIYNPVALPQAEYDAALCRELKKKYGEYLLMVGRFETDKDQITVIRARKILEEKYQLKPKLVFVGGGSTLKKCKAYAEKIGLKNNVIFMGERQDVQNFYASARVFVHSSPAEGLPTVLLEAMNYGLPVVATDSPPGVSEILQNDKYGIRCNIADPYDMADKLAIMLTDTEKREHYILQGKERLKDFTFEKISMELKELLASLK
ncbi:MAG: glycosyltransferase [Clostridium sp.]|nr:glycosyltransferase [Clostridium sp.]